MRVLVACEFSGVVRTAFTKKGHDAISCDLRGYGFNVPLPGKHIKGDVRPLLRKRWGLVIAHPPCTYLCNSGVRWLVKGGVVDEKRRQLMIEGCEFFKECLGANADKVCVENPVMHKYARWRVGRYPDQTVQPWQFGHGETKATCLWLKGLPRLNPTKIVNGREGRVHQLCPTVDRSMYRSITYQGIADAMADQWG
jgi:hypothetical protein